MDALLMVFLRSLIIFCAATFLLKMGAYESYWLTIVHDVVSLLLLRS